MSEASASGAEPELQGRGFGVQFLQELLRESGPASGRAEVGLDDFEEELSQGDKKSEIPGWSDVDAWEFLKDVEDPDTRCNLHLHRFSRFQPLLAQAADIFGPNAITEVVDGPNPGFQNRNQQAQHLPNLQVFMPHFYNRNNSYSMVTSPSRTPRQSPTGRQTSSRELEASLHKNVQSSLCQWMYMRRLPFREAQDPNLAKFVHTVTQAARRSAQWKFTPPSVKDIGGRFLDDLYLDSMTKLKEAIVDARDSIPQRPLTLVTDGWKNVNRSHVMNFMVVDAAKKSDFYFKQFICEDTTSLNLHSEVSNVLADLCNLFRASEKKEIIQALIVDNAVNMALCGKLIEMDFPHVTSIPCQCHAFSLLLKSFCTLRFIEQQLSRALEIVFHIRNHGFPLSKYREIMSAVGSKKELRAHASARSASMFFVVERLLQVRDGLNIFIDDEEYKEWLENEGRQTQEQGARVRDAVGDQVFWQRLKAIKDLLEPVVVAIRLFDRTAPTMGYVWEAWESVRQALRKVQGFSARQVKALTDLLDSREADYKSCDLFGAARCLNPKYRGVAQPVHAYRQLGNIVVKSYGMETPAYHDFYSQYTQFIQGTHAFENPSTISQLNSSNNDPYNRWAACKFLDIEAPQLFRVACHVLALPASNSSSERNFKAIGGVQTLLRNNRLTEERVEKLVHIYHNSEGEVKQIPLTRGFRTTIAPGEVFSRAAGEELEDNEGEVLFSEEEDENQGGYRRFGDEQVQDLADDNMSDFEGDNVLNGRPIRIRCLREIVEEIERQRDANRPDPDPIPNSLNPIADPLVDVDDHENQMPVAAADRTTVEAHLIAEAASPSSYRRRIRPTARTRVAKRARKNK